VVLESKTLCFTTSGSLAAIFPVLYNEPSFTIFMNAAEAVFTEETMCQASQRHLRNCLSSRQRDSFSEYPSIATYGRWPCPQALTSIIRENFVFEAPPISTTHLLPEYICEMVLNNEEFCEATKNIAWDNYVLNLLYGDLWPRRKFIDYISKGYSLKKKHSDWKDQLANLKLVVSSLFCRGQREYNKRVSLSAFWLASRRTVKNSFWLSRNFTFSPLDIEGNEGQGNECQESGWGRR